MNKKVIAGLAVVVLAIGYVVYSMRGTSTPAVATSETSVPSETTSSSATSSSSGSSSSSSSNSALKDGTYTGAAEDAVYGTVQVQAVVSGGKLASVNILQRPDAPGHTTEVNDAALPQLTQEAITAQSAQVDIVSGATQTSEAFEQSLANALQSAQA